MREPVGYALCGFYAAAFKTLLAGFDMPSDTRVVECRGVGASACVLAIELSARSPGPRDAAALALSLIVGLAGVDAAAQPAPAARVRKTLVMPFENVTRESRIVWLGEAAAVLLADDLTALGVDAISGEDRREAFERLQVPAANALTDATYIRIGELIGASEIVVGTLRLQGETILVRARSIVLETGKIRVDVTEAGPFVDFFAILERIARRIAPPSSRSRDERLHAHPPVAAFENYIKGLLAETPATAINYLNAALKVQSSFDRARLALWRVYTDQGEHDRALAAIRPIPAGSPWAGRARFLAGLSQIDLKRYDEAFATFKGLGETAPGAAAVLNNLGVVQVRRGSTPQTGEAVYYFNRAAETDPTGADYFFNLGYAYWLARDTQAAIYWLREAVRRDPTDGEAHFVLSAALAAAGSAAESSRERELASRLTPAFEEWATRPPVDPVPRGLERIRTSLEESFAPTHRRGARVDRPARPAGARPVSPRSRTPARTSRRTTARPLPS